MSFKRRSKRLRGLNPDQFSPHTVAIAVASGNGNSRVDISTTVNSNCRSTASACDNGTAIAISKASGDGICNSLACAQNESVCVAESISSESGKSTSEAHAYGAQNVHALAKSQNNATSHVIVDCVDSESRRSSHRRKTTFLQRFPEFIDSFKRKSLRLRENLNNDSSVAAAYPDDQGSKEKRGTFMHKLPEIIDSVERQSRPMRQSLNNNSSEAPVSRDVEFRLSHRSSRRKRSTFSQRFPDFIDPFKRQSRPQHENLINRSSACSESNGSSNRRKQSTVYQRLPDYNDYNNRQSCSLRGDIINHSSDSSISDTIERSDENSCHSPEPNIVVDERETPRSAIRNISLSHPELFTTLNSRNGLKRQKTRFSQIHPDSVNPLQPSKVITPNICRSPSPSAFLTERTTPRSSMRKLVSSNSLCYGEMRVQSFNSPLINVSHDSDPLTVNSTTRSRILRQIPSALNRRSANEQSTPLQTTNRTPTVVTGLHPIREYNSIVIPRRRQKNTVLHNVNVNTLNSNSYMETLKNVYDKFGKVFQDQIKIHAPPYAIVCAVCSEVFGEDFYVPINVHKTNLLLKPIVVDDNPLLLPGSTKQESDGSISFNCCKGCYKDLRASKLPTLSYANSLEIPLKVPEQLIGLTQSEKIAISPIVIYQKLFKVKGGLYSSKGNAVSFFQDTNHIVESLNELPRTPAQIADHVYLVTPSHPGAKKVVLDIIKSLRRRNPVPKHLNYLRIRKAKVISALTYLKENNPYFSHIQINNGEELIDDGVPETFLNILERNLESNNEESTTLDDEVNDDPRQPHIQQDEENIRDELNEESLSETHSDIGETVAIDMVVPDSERHDLRLESLIRQIENARGESLNESLRVDVAQNINSYGGNANVVFTRPFNNFAKDTTTQGFLSLAFPWLFPDGKGVFNCSRQRRISFREYVKHLLKLVTPRFQADSMFVFYCLNRWMRSSTTTHVSYIFKANKASTMRAIHSIDVNEALDPKSRSFRTLSNLIHTFENKSKGSVGHKLDGRNTARFLTRQFGCPDLFLTSSSAEMHWDELQLNIVRKRKLFQDPSINVKHIDTDYPDVRNLSPAHRRINAHLHPVEVTRDFTSRMKAWLTCVRQGILGDCTSYFVEIEYQKRLSMHGHGLYHLKLLNDLLLLKTDDKEEAQEADENYFRAIDYLISARYTNSTDNDEEAPPTNEHCCRRPFVNADVEEMKRWLNKLVAAVQIHSRCSIPYCKSAQDQPCRFGFPKEICQYTTWETNIVKNSKDEEVKEKKLRIKRDHPRVNAYMPLMLMLWRSNVDATPVTSSFAALAYLTKYITKTEPNSIPTMLSAAVDKTGGTDFNQDTWKRVLTRLIINSCTTREIGIHEATVILLGLPTRYVYPKVYNLYIPHQKHTICTIEHDDDGSVLTIKEAAIWQDYPARPVELTEISLMEYISKYEKIPASRKKRNDVTFKFLENIPEVSNYILRQLNVEELKVVNLAPALPYDYLATKESVLRLLRAFKPWRNSITLDNDIDTMNVSSQDLNLQTLIAIFETEIVVNDELQKYIESWRKFRKAFRKMDELSRPDDYEFAPNVEDDLHTNNEMFNDHQSLNYPIGSNSSIEDLSLIPDFAQEYSGALQCNSQNRTQSTQQNLLSERRAHNLLDASISCGVFKNSLEKSYNFSWHSMDLPSRSSCRGNSLDCISFVPSIDDYLNNQRQNVITINEVVNIILQNRQEQRSALIGQQALRATPLEAISNVERTGEEVSLDEGLSTEQYSAYNKIVMALAKEEPCYVKLIGPGGTGKSKVINVLRKLFSRFSKEENPLLNRKKLLVVAYTGIAATNVDGNTIHSTFKIKVNSSRLGKMDISTFYNLTDVALIVIDEIYMVSLDILKLIDERMRKVKQNESMFGGVSVLVCGDPLQLKPIGGDALSKQHKRNKITLWHNTLWEHQMLTKSYRHSNPIYADALKHMRLGSCTELDLEMYRNRTLESNPLLPSVVYRDMYEFIKSTRIICGTNVFVRSYNEMIQSILSEKSNTQICKIKCKNTTVTTTSTRNNNCAEREEDIANLEEIGRILYLAVGDKVYITQNLCTEAGIVNGTQGVVSGIIYSTHESFANNEQPLGVRVRVLNEAFNQTFGYKDLLVQPTAMHFDADSEKDMMNKSNKPAQLTMIPLRLSYAATVHKSQGQTLSSVVVDLQSCTFTTSLAYTSFSRCKELNKLFIVRNYAMQNCKQFIGGISSDYQAELDRYQN